EAGLPFGLLLPPFFLAIPVCVDFGRYLERRVGPVQGLAGRFDLGGAQWRPVYFFGTRGIGCALADDGAAANERRALALLRQGLCLDDGGIDRGNIVPVDTGQDIPAIAFKTLGGVIAEPVLDPPINGNAVVVIKNDELGQLQGARQRAGLV